MGGVQESKPPVPKEDLEKIAVEACGGALENVTSYDHGQVSQWTSSIIKQVLQSLITATKPAKSTDSSSSSTAPSTPPYRFSVNCTIIQQGSIPAEAAESPDKVGKRGMYTASGAYWDVNRDGMWTYKYPGADEKGMDLVLSVIWFAVN